MRRASCSRMPEAVGRSCVFDSCCLDLRRPFLALTAIMFTRRAEPGIYQAHSSPTPRFVSPASTTPAARSCHLTQVSHSPFLDQVPAPIEVLSAHRSGQALSPSRCPAAQDRRKNDERPKLASPRRPTAPLLRTPTSPPLGSSAACCTIFGMRDSRIDPLRPRARIALVKIDEHTEICCLLPATPMSSIVTLASRQWLPVA